MYSEILQPELAEILILLWDLATGAREKSYMYYGEFITEAHQNTDFAMGFRYSNPREMLYVQEDFTAGAHRNTDFAMGFRYRIR